MTRRDLSGTAPIKRQCSAHLTDGTGRRCRLSAIRGSNVCHKHGAGAPQVKAKAQRTLMELREPALAHLGKLYDYAERVAEKAPGIVMNPTLLAADKTILDRTGSPAGVSIDVELKIAETHGAEIAAFVRSLIGDLAAAGLIDPLDERLGPVVRGRMLALGGGPEPENVHAPPKVARRIVEERMTAPAAGASTTPPLATTPGDSEIVEVSL